MRRTLGRLLLVLMLATAFSAAAVHPYDHDIDTAEALDCQVCLHHAASPFAAGHPPLQLLEPVFHDAGLLRAGHNRLTWADKPAVKARGPPLSI